MLTYADVCWCMLTYVEVCSMNRIIKSEELGSEDWQTPRWSTTTRNKPGVCWHMWTYTGVFWRILTYADVCWRMVRVWLSIQTLTKCGEWFGDSLLDALMMIELINYKKSFASRISAGVTLTTPDRAGEHRSRAEECLLSNFGTWGPTWFLIDERMAE